MTIRETIAKLHVIQLESRLNKLQEMGAPEIVISGTEKLLEEAKVSNIKVNGLERKHQVGDVTVEKLYQEETTGFYYKGGKQKTLVLKMITSEGTFYYDYHDNKIGKSSTELSALINENKFEKAEA